MTQPKTIAVLGGTGTTGSQVIAALLAAKSDIKIRALVRNVEKARSSVPAEVDLVPIADVTDINSVTEALKGVDALYAMCPPLVERQITADAITALAAFQAGVKHVVYLSCVEANPTSDVAVLRAHGIAENIYKQYKYPLTILRASWFMDNHLKSASALYCPIPCPPVPYISAKDIGSAAARALLDRPDVQKGKIYELYHPEVLSYDEISAILADAVGIPAPPVIAMPKEDLAGALRELGETEFSADAIVELMAADISGLENSKNLKFQNLVGREPQSFREWANENALKFKIDSSV
ncbi:hypothetical protein HDV00_005849 [Rhizophlyctis rosea]|nr:hypothetical protein HDV00_005849 [Rhizophlyctis rosea]